jgi:hypothetical protein
MEKHIGVRVPFQPLFEGYLHPSQDQLSPFGQAMNIIPEANLHQNLTRVSICQFQVENKNP